MVLVFGLQVSNAEALGISWYAPTNYTYKGLLGEGEKSIVWLYEISNKKGGKETAYIKITLVTDTGKQYDNSYSPMVEAQVLGKDSKEYKNCLTMGTDFYPGITKKGIAIFPGVDPRTTKIMIYVSGLSESYWNGNDWVHSVLKITYRKKGNEWGNMSNKWETQKGL